MIAGTATASQLAAISCATESPVGWPIGAQIAQGGWDGRELTIRLIRGRQPQLADGNKRVRYLATYGAGAMRIPVKVEIIA